MTDTQLLISTITALGSVIGGMGMYIAHLHKSHSKRISVLSENYSKELKELLIGMITSSTKTAMVIENHTRLVDKLYERLT